GAGSTVNPLKQISDNSGETTNYFYYQRDFSAASLSGDPTIYFNIPSRDRDSYMRMVTSDGSLIWQTLGVARARLDIPNTCFAPETTGTLSLGRAARKWSDVVSEKVTADQYVRESADLGTVT